MADLEKDYTAQIQALNLDDKPIEFLIQLDKYIHGLIIDWREAYRSKIL